MMITFDKDQTYWGSTKLYADGTLHPFTPDGMVIHYGGQSHPTNGIVDELAKLRAWQRYHIDKKRWYDIAYNYAVGQTGTVYRLRGLNRAGATRGDIDKDGIPANEEKIAVVWIGGANQTPTPEAYAAMARIVAEIKAEIPDAPVTVHSDYSETSCPGDDWRTWRDNQGWVTMPQPDDWAKDSWEWGINNRILTADSDPHVQVTKQELAVMLQRTVRHIDNGGTA